MRPGVKPGPRGGVMQPGNKAVAAKGSSH